MAPELSIAQLPTELLVAIANTLRMEAEEKPSVAVCRDLVSFSRGLTEKTSVYFFKGEGTDWRMIYNQLSWWDFRPYQDHGWEPPLKTLPLPYSILSFGTDLTRGGMTTRHNPSWTTSTVESTGNGGMRNVSLGSGLIFPRLHSVR
jgi:hypothetical protein